MAQPRTTSICIVLLLTVLTFEALLPITEGKLLCSYELFKYQMMKVWRIVLINISTQYQFLPKTVFD